MFSSFRTEVDSFSVFWLKKCFFFLKKENSSGESHHCWNVFIFSLEMSNGVARRITGLRSWFLNFFLITRPFSSTSPFLHVLVINFLGLLFFPMESDSPDVLSPEDFLKNDTGIFSAPKIRCFPCFLFPEILCYNWVSV